MDLDFKESFGHAVFMDASSEWELNAMVNSRDIVGVVNFRCVAGSAKGAVFALWLAPCDYEAYGKDSLNRLFRQAVQQALSNNYFSRQPDGELARFDPQVDEWQGRWERPDHQDVLHL